ncbi:MAG: hypothetical protein C4293_12770 [Nitrospiraceae bacterium]
MERQKKQSGFGLISSLVLLPFIPLAVLVEEGISAAWTNQIHINKEIVMAREATSIDVEPGQYYRGGTRVQLPRARLSFVIPQEWVGAMPPGSRSFFLDSHKKPGTGIVTIVHDVTPQELLDHLNEPQVIEEGFVLHPIGSAKLSGDRITASYHSGEQLGKALAVLGHEQTAALYLFVGPKEETAYYEGLLEQLAGSTQFKSDETEKTGRQEGI